MKTMDTITRDDGVAMDSDRNDGITCERVSFDRPGVFPFQDKVSIPNKGSTHFLC